MTRAAARRAGSIALLAALLAAPRAARAEGPDGAMAIVAGAGSEVAGFIIGGTVLATGHTLQASNVGWLTIESGFVLAPLAAHAVEGEWGRGALFASVPAACVAATSTLFAVIPNTVDYGSLPQQRTMWGLFIGAQAAAFIGVVDAALAPRRARSIMVAPMVGVGHVGLQIGGVL
jgi:hypothetical protein